MNKTINLLLTTVFFCLIAFTATYNNAQGSSSDLPYYSYLEDRPEERELLEERAGKMGEDADKIFGPLPSITGVNCFDYYHFGSITTDIRSELVSYSPGDVVSFHGLISNTNNYPIAEGGLYIQVLRDNNDGDIDNGNHLVDEFFIDRDIYLDAEQEKEIDFDWKIPAKSIPGTYYLATFFVVDDRFNLSGVAQVNHMYAGLSTFQVLGENEGIFFDRNNVKINEKDYLLRRANLPIDEKRISISFPLKNTSNFSEQVSVEYKLYSWSNMIEKNLLDVKKETVNLAGRSSQGLSYVIDDLKEPVYYLNVVAEGEDIRSVLNIRIRTAGNEKGRINFVGIDEFPIRKGDEFTSFTCFHNASMGVFDGKIETTIKDIDGNVVDISEYSGAMGNDIYAIKNKILAQNDYDYLEIISKVYKGNDVVEESSIIYDCNFFSPSLCKKEFSWYWLSLLFLVIIISTFIISRRQKNSEALATLFVLLGTIYLFSIIYNTEIVNSETIHKTSQQASTPPAKDANNYNYYGPCDGGICRPLYRTIASISLNYEIALSQGNKYLTDDDTLTSNDNLILNFTKNGEYSSFGDPGTPPVLWDGWKNGSVDVTCANAQRVDYGDGKDYYRCSAGCVGYGLYAPSWYNYVSCDTPIYRVEAVSGPIICDGSACTITGSGDVKVKTTVDRTVCRARQFQKGGWPANYNNNICTIIKDAEGISPDATSVWAYSQPPNLTVMPHADGAWVGYVGPASEKIWTFHIPPPYPTIDLTASPDSVAYNSASTLSWTVTNADSCTASEGWSGNKDLSGSESTGPLTTTTTYSLTCVNSYGEATASVTVNVGALQHAVCVNNSCVIESGDGTNECSSNYDCGGGGGGGGGGTQWHSVCAQNACVVVDGPGYDECVSDTECGGGASYPYYGLCAHGSCVKLDGLAPSGIDDADRCSNYGHTCDGEGGEDEGGGATETFFSLRYTNDLTITLVGDSGIFCSNPTKIKVDDLGTEFAADVDLSVSDWGGLNAYSHEFDTNPLTESEYESGSNFRVCVDAETISSGTYNITITGDGEGALRTVTPRIHILEKSPSWKEVRLWKDWIAGLFAIKSF